MLEFLMSHESTEVEKDVSSMDEKDNGKHGGYGNEGGTRVGYWDERLEGRQSGEETCVEESGNKW